jgi:hypothetical protein
MDARTTEEPLEPSMPQEIMNLLTHLQGLDDLILEYTKPPITTVLRSKLALAREQAEAHWDTVEIHERTLARQAEAIEHLRMEHAEHAGQIAKRESGHAKGHTAFYR